VQAWDLKGQKLQAQKCCHTVAPIVSWVTVASQLETIEVEIHSKKLPVYDMEVPSLFILRECERDHKFPGCTRSLKNFSLKDWWLIITPIALWRKLIEVFDLALLL
jgi:hypothetical protein